VDLVLHLAATNVLLRLELVATIRPHILSQAPNTCAAFAGTGQAENIMGCTPVRVARGSSRGRSVIKEMVEKAIV